jgi:ParB-like chromosome segregation protein Spo0J
MKYEIHPAADIFPMISESAFQELKADIAANGLREWGTIFDGKILDGRNRYRACCELGIEMDFMECSDEVNETKGFDPIQFVLSKNLHRRHLKQSQRAMIGAKMATLERGRPKGNGSNDLLSQDDAAAMLSVSTPQVKRAKYVLEHGSQALIEAVEACEITVSMAEKLCKAEPDKRSQTRLVKEGKKAISEFIKPLATSGEQIEVDNSIGDQFDEPIVRAFRVADYRVNTAIAMLQQLSPEELDAVKAALI